jgi:hypothetical protein
VSYRIHDGWDGNPARVELAARRLSGHEVTADPSLRSG